MFNVGIRALGASIMPAEEFPTKISKEFNKSE
jgi:hypothetical protein